MEQVYRRRQAISGVRKRQAESGGRYRQAVVKQSVVCFLLFGAILGIRFSEAPELEAVQNSVRLIITEQTDFAGLPKEIYGFLEEYIFNREQEDFSDKEALLHMTAPVEAEITSGFGVRNHPLDGGEKFHYGVDLAAESGAQIKAAEEGEAVEAGFDASYGNYILLRHGESIYTLYAHCDTLLLKQGDTVKKGQTIATVGQTGGATGPHLHFEIRDENTWLDPAEFITFRQETDND